MWLFGVPALEMPEQQLILKVVLFLIGSGLIATVSLLGIYRLLWSRLQVEAEQASWMCLAVTAILTYILFLYLFGDIFGILLKVLLGALIFAILLTILLRRK